MNAETKEEIVFLKDIGSYYDGPKRDYSELDEHRHLRLLKRYRDAMPKRVVWEGIDPFSVSQHVNGMIEALGGNGISHEIADGWGDRRGNAQ